MNLNKLIRYKCILLVFLT